MQVTHTHTHTHTSGIGSRIHGLTLMCHSWTEMEGAACWLVVAYKKTLKIFSSPTYSFCFDKHGVNKVNQH